MTIALDCSCGKSYRLNDDLVGKLVQCPACGNKIRVQTRPPEPIAVENNAVFDLLELEASSAAKNTLSKKIQVNSAFDRDQFFLKQKLLSLSEKYYVHDEGGLAILFIQRPKHYARSFKAGGIALVVGLGIFFLGLALGIVLGSNSEILIVTFGCGGLLLGIVVGCAILFAMHPKRHIEFYTDDSLRNKLLEVRQDKKVAVMNATFTLLDSSGTHLANFSKNYLYDVFRKRWRCTAPDGKLIFTAQEDSLLLAFARRALGLVANELRITLRTNFIFLDSPSNQILGRFNRKATIRDYYVLDMTEDPERKIDRRIAVSMGVLLDTGEGR